VNFNHHGNYNIEQKQGFFVVSFSGSWNVEAAQDFFESFKEIVSESGYHKFGVLTDLREWEGSTPDALRLAKDGLDYFYSQGQVLSVHVNNSGVKQQFIEPMQKLQASRMVFEQFHSMEIAMPWMKAKVKQLIYNK